MMRILYVASEAVPFAKTGGLADVVGSLPKSIKELGHEAVVVIPRYRGIRVKEPPLSSLTVPLGGVWRFCSI
jgi:starch synthase